MRTALEIRLETIRNVRRAKLEAIDREINTLSDEGADTTELRAHRQRLRDITNPYKELLSQEGDIPHNEDSPLLRHDWNVFASVDWN